jgi:vesicle coat complex subunit
VRSIALVLACVALVAGCGKKGPVVSHGKPVSDWVRALQDPDPKVRKKAVVALGHAGTADPADIPALTSALKDADKDVRGQAILALLNIGPPAKEAVPSLEEAQKDQDPTIRSYAAKALERIRGR